jgi:predicted protein tyrosine phosphatase
MGQKFSRILPVPSSTSKPVEDCVVDVPVVTTSPEHCSGELANEPAVYVGPMEFVLDGNVLTELGITAVVTLLAACPPEIPKVLTDHGIGPSDHFVFPLEDSSESYISLFHNPGIQTVVDFIFNKRKEGKQVLVHCDKGLTRSPAVVVAYLMKYGPKLATYEPMAYSEATKLLVRQRGPKVDIRLFERELRKWERQLHADDTASVSSSTSFYSPRSELTSPVLLSLPKNRTRGKPHPIEAPSPHCGIPSSDSCALASRPNSSTSLRSNQTSSEFAVSRPSTGGNAPPTSQPTSATSSPQSTTSTSVQALTVIQENATQANCSKFHPTSACRPTALLLLSGCSPLVKSYTSTPSTASMRSSPPCFTNSPCCGP